MATIYRFEDYHPSRAIGVCDWFVVGIVAAVLCFYWPCVAAQALAETWAGE